MTDSMGDSMSTKRTAKELAEDHWAWLETVCRKMFVDAFIHGYKHGQEDLEKALEVESR